MAWIFRSSQPLLQRIRETSSEEWSADQHHSLMSPGDLVFFWEGDATGQFVGVGRLQTQAYRWPNDPRRLRIRVGHNLPLTTPLTAKECRADPILRELPVLQRDDQTNYGLSRAHVDRLLAVLAAREPKLPEELNLKPETIPRLEDLPVAEPQETEPAQPLAAGSPWDEVFTDALNERVEAFRADPVNAKMLALRMAAYARLRRFLTPEVLAEVTIDRFEQELTRFGDVVIEGKSYPLRQALHLLRDATPEEITKMLDEGKLRTEGNLTWATSSLLPGSAEKKADVTALSLRLRAGLAHLLNANRPLVSRIDRMRRSVDALWPETATGILMMLHPDEYLVYHRNAREALRILGVAKPLRNSLEDYLRYMEFVRRFEETFAFGSLPLIDLFLARVAEPEWPPGDDASEETDAPSRGTRTSRAVAKTRGSVGEPPPAKEPASAALTEQHVRREHVPTEGQAVFALYQHLRHEGIVITVGQTINLYLSLKTVPILVLDGPAGVGKNLIIRAFSESVGARFHWVPMTNESGTGPANAPLRMRDLLGQMDPRTGEYRPEMFYEAILEAHENPDTPVVICVDSIDGWQEDAWLSEYVRLHDSRSLSPDGRWLTSPLVAVPGYETLTAVGGRSVPARFSLPDNVFLVITTMGQVALGEITSERTNVVNLGPADLSLEAARPGHAPEGTSPTDLGTILVEQRPYRDLSGILDRPWAEVWNNEIVHLSGMLEDLQLGIGYRLRDDILRYLAYADDLNTQLPYGVSFPLAMAFDYQIEQRILPRLLTKEPDEETVAELLMYAQGSQGNAPRFPRAATHLELLQRRME